MNSGSADNRPRAACCDVWKHVSPWPPYFHLTSRYAWQSALYSQKLIINEIFSINFNNELTTIFNLINRFFHFYTKFNMRISCFRFL